MTPGCTAGILDGQCVIKCQIHSKIQDMTPFLFDDAGYACRVAPGLRSDLRRLDPPLVARGCRLHKSMTTSPRLRAVNENVTGGGFFA
jgi:hypothetical protein